MNKSNVVRNKMSVKTVIPFLVITFGLSWGIAALLIFFTDQVVAIFGEITNRNPMYILMAYSPGIAGAFLVWRHYGLKGLRSFFRRMTLWRMPLVQDLRKDLDSPFADMSNIGAGPEGGAITAALFLGEFVPRELPWLHLDIAGRHDHLATHHRNVMLESATTSFQIHLQVAPFGQLGLIAAFFDSHLPLPANSFI